MVNVICTVCPKGCRMKVDEINDLVEGNSCKRGFNYGLAEVKNPIRVITSTVNIKNGTHSKLPVKTSEAIAKSLNFEAMKIIKTIVVQSPIKCGDCIIENFLNTGANLIATRNM